MVGRSKPASCDLSSTVKRCHSLRLTLLWFAGPAEGISALQFQAVQMACAKHETFLADGKTRAGFFLGDGAHLLPH